MTSTNPCKLGSRNSSRVLKPPGGANDTSFNIFGVPNEDRKVKVEQPTVEVKCDQDAVALEKDTTEQTVEHITTTEGADGESPQHDEKVDNSVEATDSQNNNEVAKEQCNGTEEGDVKTGKDESGACETQTEDTTTSDQSSATVPTTSSDSTSATTAAADAKNRTPNKNCGFNPITGEPYNKVGDDAKVAQTTNVRVRQPPGGASSKLW